MRKLLLPLLAILLFTACKKEIATDKVSEEIASATANRTSPKITICHYDGVTGKNITIVINETAWPEHQAHGDLRGSCSDVVVTICGKDWMKKNLDVSTYRNGEPIPQVTDPTEWAGLTTGAWCYYNNDPANGAIYGKLYNWYAVNDSRGLAPIGWHVPTDAEWTTLATCLDAISPTGNVGGKMKSTGTIEANTGLWRDPNTGATNSSGFTSLPAGYRNFDGNPFYNINYETYMWSSTDCNSATTAMARWLASYNGSLNTDVGGDDKHSGVSVRCIRD